MKHLYYRLSAAPPARTIPEPGGLLAPFQIIRGRLRSLCLVGLAVGGSLLGNGTARAQATLDPSFGTGGRVFTTFTPAPTTDRAGAMAVQADGRIVVVGGSEGKVGFQIARYLPDGTLDGSFGNGGKVITLFPDAAVPPYGYNNSGPIPAWTVTIQADQKLVVGGRRVYEWALARYNPDGSLDASFGTGGKVTYYTGSHGGGAARIRQQSSGKLVVLGTGASLNYQKAEVRRFTQSGALDATFSASSNPFSGINQVPSDAFVDAADRTVLLGYGANTVPGTGGALGAYQGYLARLLPNGTHDASFGTNGLVPMPNNSGNSVTPLGMRQLPNGQILVVGHTGNGSFLARFSADGVLDASFGTNGVQQFPGFTGSFAFYSGAPLLGLAVQPDGKIVVRGTSGDDFALARFEANGTPDASFGVNGQVRIHEGAGDALTDLAIQPDGKYLGVGYSAEAPGRNSRFALVRVLPTATCTSVNAGADRSLCSLASTTLGSGAQNGLSYSWSVSPAISGFSSSSAQASVTVPDVSTATDYVFTLTATAAANAQCVAADQVRVTVWPRIDAGMSAQASPAAVTAGQAVTLRVPNAQAGVTYTWSGPGVANATGSSITTVPPSSGTYTVVASLGSCTRQAQVNVQVSGTHVPDWAWARSGGSTGEEQVAGVVNDAAGNSYVVGTFEGAATFGNVQLISQGSQDVFLAKYSPAGSLQWARRYGGSGPDAAYGIARDPQGNIVLTGSYAGSIAFGNTTLTSPAAAELYVTKLDAEGNALWAKSNEAARANSLNAGRDVAVDANGYLYVTGSSTNAFTWSGSTAAASGSNAEVITLKMDAQGELVWLQRFGGSSPDYGMQIAVDIWGGVYVAGTFTDATNVGGVALQPVFGQPSSGQSVFLVKYHQYGYPVWASTAGGTGLDYPQQLLVTGPSNSMVTDVYLLMQGNSPSMYFGSNQVTKSSTGAAPDSYVAYIYGNTGYSPSGFRLGTCAANSFIRASDMVLRGGVLSITGWFDGTVNFGSASLTTPAGSGNLGFVLNCSTSGATQWVKQSASGDALGTALSIDNLNNHHVAGTFGAYTTSAFGASGITTRGAKDAFVARLGNIPPSGITWTGAVSSAWTNSANWSPSQVPGATDDVIIPGGLTLYPELSTNQAVGSLDLQGGATLTQVGGTLGVNGGFTVAGSFVQNAGTLALTGSSPQTLSASAVTLHNFYVGAAGARLGGPTQVRGLLTLVGNLDTNGQPLTLVSDAAGTAAVVNTGGVVQGQVTVQRWIDPSTNAGRGYRHLSSPVAGSTVADLATPSFTPVVNAAYNTAANPGSITPYPSVFGYNEQRLVLGAGFDAGWESPASLNEPLAVGRSYTVNLHPQTVDFVGALTSGNVSIPLQRGANGQGWNLVGNPYPSPLDWGLVSLPATIDAAAYVYRSTGPYAGGYQAYVNGIGAPGAQLLALGQGFFVRANSGTPTLALTNAARPATLLNPAMQRPQNTRPLLALSLRATGNPAAPEDMLYIYQQAGATLGFDSAFDALKVQLNGGQQPTLYQQAGTTALSIQGIPEGYQAVDLALTVHAPVAGAFSFAPTQLANFPATAPLYLEDRQTGVWHDLRQGSYVAQLSQGLTTTRFVLHLYAQRPLAAHSARFSSLLSVYPNPAQSGQVMVKATGLPNGAAELRVHNALGQVILQQSVQVRGSTLQHELSLGTIPAGVYSLQLVTPGGYGSQRLVVQ